MTNNVWQVIFKVVSILIIVDFISSLSLVVYLLTHRNRDTILLNKIYKLSAKLNKAINKYKN